MFMKLDSRMFPCIVIIHRKTKSTANSYYFSTGSVQQKQQEMKKKIDLSNVLV